MKYIVTRSHTGARVYDGPNLLDAVEKAEKDGTVITFLAVYDGEVIDECTYNPEKGWC